jgi:hypothetical protein
MKRTKYIFEFIESCKKGDLGGAKKYLFMAHEKVPLKDDGTERTFQEKVRFVGRNIYTECGMTPYTMAFYKSCKYGHLKVAQWLRDTIGNKIEIQIHCNEDIVGTLSSRGEFEVLKWIFETCFPIKEEFPIYLCLEYSCKNDHLDIAKWAIKIIKSFPSRYPEEMREIFITLCEMGKLESIILLTKKFKKEFDRKFICRRYYGPINLAIENSHQDVTLWLIKRFHLRAEELEKILQEHLYRRERKKCDIQLTLQRREKMHEELLLSPHIYG